jgi:ABC-type nitrate/sulfonate/bicarbonate transport system substrate-binding protein
MRRIHSLAALTAAITLAAGAAQAQQKLVIGMPTSPPNVVHMPVVVAKDLGLYKQCGVDAEMVALDGGVKVYRAMLSGNVDVGMVPAAVAAVGVSKGADVKAVVAPFDKFEASMIVRGNVKTMADLKGKRIGIQQPGGFADILSHNVLRAAKIDRK